ncbi:putative ferredoxin:thioredoxin reductase [Medicago truncatula]|uniref:Ferredoxin-thioredoxin reductase, variable chain n=1 Tax=Medicago truncatula TaxID=3880 RepID=I3SXR8_MEDTR|nr:ferredoxin-thioredoxin reductase, variable chain [Medicago truncatula]AFK45060.1 unknown [Medicago truncatula]KEH24727.1 ferredoxin-thioredoxin reductase, variable chain [Medicago truncatula]RHN49659.1 putative ferredoxin:thioredoxin reductase [Medicago truncatula]
MNMNMTSITSSIATLVTPLPLFMNTKNKIQSRSSKMTRIRCDVGEEDSSSSTAKIGSRVRVKVPLKVYHVPKVPEVDLTGREGQIKQNVTFWKDNKRISANLPYKVEFVADDIQGPRGPLKFVAHLKDDEFEFLE